MKKVKYLFIAILSTVVALAVSISLTAAQSPAPTSPPSSPPTVPPATSSDIRVVDAYRLGQQEEEAERNSAGINDTIVIRVNNLQSLVNEAKCLDDNDQRIQNCQEQEIALFLDGREIEGIVPSSGAPQPEDQTLQFRLQHTADNGEAWVNLLGAPPLFSHKFFRRPTEVSVGLENGFAKPSDVEGDDFKLIRIHQGLFWFCLIGLIVLLVGMVYLAKNSDILRNLGPIPDEGRKPFSLARSQMAFWFFLVIASFLFIWLVTGVYDIITPSVLGLIGIGAGTALGAAAIDVGKHAEIKSQISSLDSLEAERKLLEIDINKLDKETDGLLGTELSEKLSQLQKDRNKKLNELYSTNKQNLELLQKEINDFLTQTLRR